jgi:hypothetical protein
MGTFPILLISGGTMLSSLLLYAGGTVIVIRSVAGLVPQGRQDIGFWKSVAVMMILTLITAAMHLTAIALWACVYLLCGEQANFESALYFSAQNYTALGYGDVLLSAPWRMLGPLESINGLLLMGLSTAGMFAVLNRLVTNHLRHQINGRSTGSEPLSRDQGNHFPLTAG